MRHGRFASPGAPTCPRPRCSRSTRPEPRPAGPAVLMSRLPGRVDWWPSDAERWLRRLAWLLPRIHAAPLPPVGVLRPFAPYPQASYRPPGWARYPRMWERAAEISHGPPPGLPAVLLHRDFHPGNVLWRRGTVTGVVD